jgi:hypothetical protein
MYLVKTVIKYTQSGTTIQMEVNIYATNVAKMQGPRTATYNNKWGINVTNLVPTASDIYGLGLGGPRNRSGRHGDETNFTRDSNSDLSAVQPTASSL